MRLRARSSYSLRSRPAAGRASAAPRWCCMTATATSFAPARVLHDGDAAFIRHAAPELAARGQCEIAVLAAGATPVAAGIILKHDTRAFWFKLVIDARLAMISPGVQLALELTRYFCADPSVDFGDSTAPADSPMINPL